MDTPLRKLSELATVTPGFSPKPTERKKNGTYLLLGGRNIKDGTFATTPADAYVDLIDRESFRRAIARRGDVIVSTLFDRRKLYLYKDDDPPAVVNNSCAIIRAGAQSDYIISYLRSQQGTDDFLEKASKVTAGTFIPRVSVADLAGINIPILPVEKLARLGDAHIGKSSTKQLLELQRELESKNAEIERLHAEYNEAKVFFEDRLRAVTEQLATNSLASRIKHGEATTLEFKSSLRWNLHAKKNDPAMENTVLKTIVAFCNTKGGDLLIGVADDGTILGIEHDGFPNEDRFQLHLRNLLMDRIEPSVAGLVEFNIVRLEGKPVCHVTCQPSTREEIWFKPDKSGPEQFFVRLGPSSTELPPREAFVYIRDHFSERAK